MAIQSMTGFARVEGNLDDVSWIWEVRSVNGKGLDFRLRTPPGYDHLNAPVRKCVTGNFSRGNLQITLTLERPGAEGLPVVNQPALDAVLEAIAGLRKQLGSPRPAAEQILAIKGVLEISETAQNEQQREALNNALLDNFQVLLKELQTARTSEGTAIAGLLTDQLQRIETLAAAISADPSLSLDEIKNRLHEQVSRLLDSASEFDTERLHQEAAILAAKGDIREELDRLNAHVIAARQLLEGSGPIGRKFDFLCQEFNRECNTICSKSNAATLTAHALDMKVAIDQLREQVQNLE